MSKAYNQETILVRFRQIHGDRFDYSEVVYKGCRVLVTIICRIHGFFRQRPSDHIHQQQGCPKCVGKQLSIEERFWRLVKKTPSCWIWKSSIRKSGYGKFRLYEGQICVKHLSAHRFSWELHNGSIPSGMLVCHKCDNPVCVRPDHLFLGTPKDNVVDMIRKGRQKYPAGEQAGQAKLDSAQVLDIRDRFKRGETGKALAEEYRVSRAEVSRIVNNKRWVSIKQL
jgi:hypothetical protein